MRVLILKKGFYPTADEYAKCLGRLGVDVTAATIAPSGMVASQPNVPSVTLPDAGPVKLLRELADVTAGFDVVHYLPGRRLELLPLVNRRARFVFDYRSVSVSGRRWKDAAVDFGKRLQPLLADCVIMSDELMHRRIGPLLGKPVRYMPVGYAGELFFPCTGRPQGKRLVYHGIVVPYRRLEGLIDAVAHLGREFTLTIAGGGDDGYIAALRDRAARLGCGERVELLGHMTQAELQPLICTAYLCLVYVPAIHCYQGQFPAKLLESLACLRPVVATRTEATSRFARQFGEGRFLLANDDPVDLARTIAGAERYVESFYDPGRLESLAREVPRHTWQQLVEHHLLPIYRELLD